MRRHHVTLSAVCFDKASFKHAIKHILESSFFQTEADEPAVSWLQICVECDEYMNDLLAYGPGMCEVDFAYASPDE